MIRLDILQNCLSDLPMRPRLAVETGTFEGRSTRRLALEFERVITIEVDAQLAALTKETMRAEGFTHVEYLQGDSGLLLKQVVTELAPEGPVFFFLDAHWSGDQSVDWESSLWKGYGVETGHRGLRGRSPTSFEQTPLHEELQAITDHCLAPCLILIDDIQNLPASGPGLRDTSFQGEDWSHLTREGLLRLIGERLIEAREIKASRQLLLRLRPLNQTSSASSSSSSSSASGSTRSSP